MKYPWYGVEDETERQRLFIEYAKEHFGEADEETKAFRQRCKELGGVVVLHATNMTNEQVIAFLEDEETQKILADPGKYSVI